MTGSDDQPDPWCWASETKSARGVIASLDGVTLCAGGLRLFVEREITLEKNLSVSRRHFLVMAGRFLAGASLAQACQFPSMTTGQGARGTPTPRGVATSEPEQATPTLRVMPTSEPEQATPTVPVVPTSEPEPATPTPRVVPTTEPEQPTATPGAYEPHVEPDDTASRVVHVFDSGATSWDFSTGWHGEYVDQDVVYRMVDQGVMRLTSTPTRAAAWQALIPDYVSGQRVAIKVNLNNAGSDDDDDNIIDALIEPVNALVRGLREIGVAESDIWVYDAMRWIPNRFRDGCDFPGVQFSGRWAANAQGFSDTERVAFQPPAHVPPLAEQRISNVLANADYLINMPIMKRHGGVYVTLSFKNHLGSIERPDLLHEHIEPAGSIYTPQYNPMVEMYQNPHFVGKTILTVGDGLYGCRPHNYSEPEPWESFSNQAPNSLFFSTDTVAIDCVMYDFLEAEVGVKSGGDDYLRLAAQEGLGVFEHRAPEASDPEGWYSLIDYVYLNLSPSAKLYLPCALRA